jgi:hypothetical protein
MHKRARLGDFPRMARNFCVPRSCRHAQTRPHAKAFEDYASLHFLNSLASMRVSREYSLLTEHV